MDRYTKTKIKEVNRLLASIAYEVGHIERLMFHKHPRSLTGVLNQTKRVARAYVRIRMLYVQIRIIKETPRPKYPSGGMCGIIDERGPEMVIRGCNANLINPIQSVTVDMKTNKVIKVNKVYIAAHDGYSFQLAHLHNYNKH